MHGLNGGERGIRTLDTTLWSYAPLAGEYLQPLGHLTVFFLFVCELYNLSFLCQIFFQKKIKFDEQLCVF